MFPCLSLRLVAFPAGLVSLSFGEGDALEGCGDACTGRRGGGSGVCGRGRHALVGYAATRRTGCGRTREYRMLIRAASPVLPDQLNAGKPRISGAFSFPEVSRRFPTSLERVSAGVTPGVRLVKLFGPIPEYCHARSDGRGRGQIRGKAMPLLSVGV